MSAAEFQKRIADLTFSAQEHVKALRQEQDDSERIHLEWEEADHDIDRDEDDEPEVIDHSTKIAHIETAIGHLEAAVDELDGALDEQ